MKIQNVICKVLFSQANIGKLKKSRTKNEIFKIFKFYIKI